MNLLKKAAISLAATSLVVAPVVASAAQAPAVGSSRAVATAQDKNSLEGENGILIALLAAAAIIAGIIVAADGGNNKPTSP